jgi:hypothetical protein
MMIIELRELGHRRVAACDRGASGTALADQKYRATGNAGLRPNLIALPVIATSAIPRIAAGDDG